MVEKIAEDLQPLVVPMSQLHLDDENARKHSNKNLQTISESLKRFGQQTPIKILADGTIKKGNGTFLAAQALGWKQIAASVYDSQENVEAYAITDNRAGELGEWDYQALQYKFQTLQNDFDLLEFGWDKHELDMIMQAEFKMPDVKEEDFDEAVQDGEIIRVTKEQKEIIEHAVDKWKLFTGNENAPFGMCLVGICEQAFKGENL